MDAHTLVLMFLRWIHFIAGITWIGHLYFFNFVNIPFGKTMDGGTKKLVVPELMPRALWWFRWGAMWTFLSGVVYMYWKYWLVGSGLTGESGLMSSTAGQWITLGALFGTVMWFNVWFIIWPAQKKIISWVKGGQSPEEMAGLMKRAALASKINTYFSFPLLFAMGASSHLPAMSPLWMIGVIVGGFAVCWFLYKMSAKAGANFGGAAA